MCCRSGGASPQFVPPAAQASPGSFLPPGLHPSSAVLHQAGRPSGPSLGRQLPGSTRQGTSEARGRGRCGRGSRPLLPRQQGTGASGAIRLAFAFPDVHPRSLVKSVHPSSMACRSTHARLNSSLLCRPACTCIAYCLPTKRSSYVCANLFMRCSLFRRSFCMQPAVR